MKTYQNSIFSMGTRFNILIPGLDGRTGDEIFSSATNELIRIENMLSCFLSDSDISYINRNAFKNSVSVNSEIFGILTDCIGFHKLTENNFDIGLGYIIDYWSGKHTEDVKLMADTFYSTGKVLQIGHQRMFDPRYLKAVELINAGEIGQITQIRAFWHRNNDWRRPLPEGRPDLERKINWRLYREYSCGLMTELASHQIQVANWFKGKTPVSVMGKGSINYWKDGREVYDNVALIYSYDDGTQFIYDSMTSNRHYGLEEQIMGDEGTLEMEVNRRYWEHPPPKPEPPPPPGIVQLMKDIEGGIFSNAIPLTNSSWIPELKVEGDGQKIVERAKGFDESKAQLEGFIASIRKGEPTKGLFEQGYWATIWALLGQKAMDEQKIIELPNELKLT